MILPPLVRILVDKKFGRFCEERIPEDLRDQVQVDYRIRGHVVTLFEKRPSFDEPGEWDMLKVAQFRYNRETNEWKLYSVDPDLRWQVYLETDPTPDLEELLLEVDVDPTGIFWG